MGVMERDVGGGSSLPTGDEVSAPSDSSSVSSTSMTTTESVVASQGQGSSSVPKTE